MRITRALNEAASDLRGGWGLSLMVLALLTLGLASRDLWRDFEEDRARAAQVAIDQAPVTEWLVVEGVDIPDHRTGEDPFVRLRRTAFVDVFGGLGTEISDAAGRKLCKATSGKNGGIPIRADGTTSEAMRLSVLAPHCRLPPGQFRLSVIARWSHHRTKVVKPMTFESNVFEVKP